MSPEQLQLRKSFKIISVQVFSVGGTFFPEKLSDPQQFRADFADSADLVGGVNMRASDDDKAPSWTLQYAVLPPPADPASGISIKVNAVPTPPYATLKQVPELTPEQAAACAGKMIVIAGILTADGKLEQMSVKKTPDPQVNSIVTEALSNWTFQPSQVDGKPVALKVMLGVRLVAR